MTRRQLAPMATPRPRQALEDAEVGGLASLPEGSRRRTADALRDRATPPSRATRGPEWLEVLRRWEWLVLHGRAGDPSGGLVGLVLEGRERATGARFMVRENLAGRGDFTTGSALRMGAKDGRLGAAGTAGLHEVLDLWTEDPAAWDRLAAMVAATDPLGRPVRRHPKLCPAWAENPAGWSGRVLYELEVTAEGRTDR